MFRVTANTLYRTSLRDMQNTAEAFAKTQQQVSSGKRFQQASDNPGAASAGLRERAEIRALDRYREANDSVDSRLRVADGVISDIVSSIITAQGKAAQGRTTVLTPEQRAALALEIDGAKEAVFTAVNTSYRGIYLFAGADNVTAPYTKTGSTISAYQGDSNAVRVDVSRTSSAAVTLDGSAVLQGTAARDLFQSLSALSTAVSTGDMAGVDAGLAELDQALTRVITAQSGVGAALSALPAEKTRLDDTRRASDARRSQAEEVNLAEAISAMTQAQQAQQAALAAAGQSQKRSLMDYL